MAFLEAAVFDEWLPKGHTWIPQTSDAYPRVHHHQSDLPPRRPLAWGVGTVPCSTVARRRNY